MADVASQRTDDHDFDVFEKSEDHMAHFTFPVRPANERRSVEDEARIGEINMSLTQCRITFTVIPTKFSNPSKQLFHSFDAADDFARRP